MGCLLSLSSAPFACLGDKKYYDLQGTIDVMKQVFSKSVVDGFELQLEPEWDSKQPPLSDRECADWTKTPKYTAQQVSDLLRGQGLPILSVHASRDIGIYLCSNRDSDLESGREVARDALFVASELNASVCVFHLWDTWATSFNTDRIHVLFTEITDGFPNVKASVENIPTHLSGSTPFTLVRDFEHVTLDLRWAALYDELDKFQSISDKLANVHLRGRLDGERWVIDRSSFDFYEGLKKITHNWKYEGLLTLEREGTLNSSHFNDFVRATGDLSRLVHEGSDRSRVHSHTEKDHCEPRLEMGGNKRGAIV